jgi:hypothetical protein
MITIISTITGSLARLLSRERRHAAAACGLSVVPHDAAARARVENAVLDRQTSMQHIAYRIYSTCLTYFAYFALPCTL